MIVAILANGLWQGAFIAAIALLAARLFARESASTRYAIWLVALLALPIVAACTTLYPIHLPAAGGASSAAAHIRITLVRANALADRATPLAVPALAIWIAGAVLSFARLAVSAARIARVRRSARPLLGYDDVLASTEITMPIATGILSPIVVVPNDVAQRLSPPDLKRIVAHERAHIERRDVATNFLQRVIEAVLFFNPWVYVMGHYLVKEREAASDDVAVARTGEIDGYVTCLAALARNRMTSPTSLVSPSALGSRRALMQRIERLVDERRRRTLKLNYYTLGGTIVLFAVATLALQLISPALAASNDGAPPVSAAVAAATCEHPNTDAKVLVAAQPNISDAELKVQHARGAALVDVTIAGDGSVQKTRLVKSSGYSLIDHAAIDAARASTYSAATRNCAAVPGNYIFRVDVEPAGD